MVCVLVFYILLFYFFFLQYSFSLLSSYSSFQRMNVTISTVNYEITVTSPYNFYTTFNVTDRSLSTLIKMGCFINNYGNAIDFTSASSRPGFVAYLSFGLASMVILLVFKSVQLMKFDLIKTLYNMSTLRTNFNMSNYIIFNLFICSLLNDHYIFYNQVFNTKLPTCLGANYSYVYGSTDTYFSDPSQVPHLSLSSSPSSLWYLCSTSFWYSLAC